MPKKLFVGNLAFSATEESIRTLFSQHGQVLSVNIPMDKLSGRPRGFCFIEMENSDEAIAKLNNVEFEGRALKVEIAQERPQRSDRGFGGGHRRERSGGFGENRNNRW